MKKFKNWWNENWFWVLSSIVVIFGAWKILSA